MENRIRENWAAGKPVLNAWLNIGHPFASEIMGSADFDCLTVDVQHGPQDYSNLLPMFQALKGSGKTLLARVPWRDPTWVMKFLDAGAMGIICPMVNDREQAEEFVSYLRYPPHGQRSWGPTRATFAYPGYNKEDANESILAFAMIETGEAMANLGEIAATPHLDALYVGPADLSIGISDGRLPPGMDREEPEVVEAIKRILEAAHDNGKRAALHTASPEYAAKAIGWGYDMVTVATDSAILVQGSKAIVSRMKDLLS